MGHDWRANANANVACPLVRLTQSVCTFPQHARYEYKLNREYARGRSWLTPVEIFNPYYGQAFARYIVKDFLVNCILPVYWLSE